ncbi:MAG: hypothetical protein AAGE61_05035 [Pseudomonadota bacterium]
MRTLILALAALALPLAAHAEEASQANSWNLVGEKMARFEGKVVDIKCEVTGVCAPNCGDGSLPLGLVRTTDNMLIPVNKNGQTSFNGGVVDLLPHCGKTIGVDGLLVGEDIPAQLYQVQLLKPEGGEWQKANLHTKEWAKQFPDAGGEGPWFRRDPRVLSQLEENGYMGLGKEEDERFIKEWY